MVRRDTYAPPMPPIKSRCSRSSCASSRRYGRTPPCQRFMRALSLPSVLRGPVDCSQGRHLWMASRCLSRCSSVHVRAAMALIL